MRTSACKNWFSALYFEIEQGIHGPDCIVKCLCLCNLYRHLSSLISLLTNLSPDADAILLPSRKPRRNHGIMSNNSRQWLQGGIISIQVQYLHVCGSYCLCVRGAALERAPVPLCLHLSVPARVLHRNSQRAGSGIIQEFLCASASGGGLRPFYLSQNPQSRNI